MIADIDAMPHDAALIQRLIDEQKITVAALANRSGFDDKTIYGYLVGRCTLPSLVLRAAFELTQDFRLVGLVTGIIPLIVDRTRCACQSSGTDQCGTESVKRRTPPLPPVSELLPLAIASVKAAADSLGYIAVITSDGVVDPASDRYAIEKFNQHAAEAINDLSRLMAALQPAMNQAGKEAAT